MHIVQGPVFTKAAGRPTVVTITPVHCLIVAGSDFLLLMNIAKYIFILDMPLHITYSG